MGDWSDHYAYDYDDDDRSSTCCRDCGSSDVYWVKEYGRFVLYGTNSRKHVCQPDLLHELRRDAFDDLDKG